ncbi:hypothetical protein ACNKHU_01520 [Shigella flexneri]
MKQSTIALALFVTVYPCDKSPDTRNACLENRAAQAMLLHQAVLAA